MPQEFPDTLKYNLPKTGCDSHAHLVYENMIEDFHDIVERAFATGLSNIGQIFLSVESYYNNRENFLPYPEIFFTLGIHPNDILQKYQEDSIEKIREVILQDTKFKAVGEIGLDYFRSEVPKPLQEKAFRAQLALAKELNLPVVIHSREAFDDTIAILDDMEFQNYPLVWHCFCGERAQIEEFNKRDWYISVSGAITYPANKLARADLHYIPKDRLLIETDCPFLSPQGWRGQRNEPALVSLSASVIAEHRKVELSQMWTECGDNARRVFRLEK